MLTEGDFGSFAQTKALCFVQDYKNQKNDMNEKRYKEAFERASEERKEKLLEVGIEEFASKGYENANINVIAKNAGISIGLM